MITKQLLTVGRRAGRGWGSNNMETLRMIDRPSVTEKQRTRVSKHQRSMVKDGYPCVVCGVPIPEPKFEVRLVCGGTKILHPDDFDRYADVAADLGFHSIGSGCVRSNPRLKGFVVKTGGG